MFRLLFVACIVFFSINSYAVKISKWHRFSMWKEKNMVRLSNISTSRIPFKNPISLSSCQHFLLYCGRSPKPVNVDNVCESEWKKINSTDHTDTEGIGPGAATSTSILENSKGIKVVFFKNPEYGNTDLINVELALNSYGSILKGQSTVRFLKWVGDEKGKFGKKNRYSEKPFGSREMVFELGVSCK